MKKIPYTNHTDSIQHIGNKTIWPGQTREVDESHIITPDANNNSQPEASAKVNSVEDVVALSVSELKKTLQLLSNEDLDAVFTAENEKEKPRSGAINAIAAEQISRASQSVGSVTSDRMDEFAKIVAQMDDDELADQSFPEGSAESVIVSDEKHRRAIILFKTEFSAFGIDDLESLKAEYSDQPDYMDAIDELIAEKSAE